jgi:hypothetical protein
LQSNRPESKRSREGSRRNRGRGWFGPYRQQASHQAATPDRLVIEPV